MHPAGPLVTTFSIVGYDPHERAWGIAIASRFLAVGAQTCWGDAEGGVVVVQAYLNARNGAEGIALLRQGRTAAETIEHLMAKDPYHHLRQLAIIDRAGRVAAYTGAGCTAWAGHIIGDHCAAQGNMLLGSEGCAAMVEHFATSKGSLSRRLTDALALGDKLGGDMRGRQAAALYIVRPAWDQPIDVFTEPTINLRVDDHADPFTELSRLLGLYELVYIPTQPDEQLPMTEAVVRRFQRVLSQRGYYAGDITGIWDDATKAAAKQLGRMDNFHKRLTSDEWIDARLLAHLEAKMDAPA